MEATKKDNPKTMWLYTFISLAVILAFLAFKPEWFWVALPFFATYLVKSLGAI
jgi:hypothetical protein